MIEVEFNTIPSCPWTQKDISTIIEIIAKKQSKIKGLVEIEVVGEQQIKKINYQYRGINRSTDVLSFAWQEDKKIKSNVLGQIFICYPVIIRQAKEFKVGTKEEFIRMLVHGALHMIGHDHMAEKDAKKMFNLQEKIVEEIKEKI